MIAAERQWALARMINDQSHERPIPVVNLREKIAEQLARTADAVRASWSSSRGTYDREDLSWIDSRLAEADLLIERPHIGPDRETGHWTWSRYTPARLLMLVNQVLTAAAAGYRDLVTRNFSTFGPALGRYSIQPFRVMGVLQIPAEENLTGRIMDDPQPVLRYFLTHDNEAANECCADIKLATTSSFDSDDAFNLIRRSAQIGGPFAPRTIHHEVLRLTGRPATEYAYRWLKDDLAEIGWD
jgi:hypothetical protein